MSLNLRTTPILLLLFLVSPLASQMTVSTGPPFTPETLIETVFFGEGLEIIDVTYEGDEAAIGLFNGGQPFVGMERGIVMSTGQADFVTQPGNVQSNGGSAMEVPNNGDLQALSGQPINDEARYTITFRPFSDTLRFRFAFASEEYPDFVCAQFNDAFGFFISGPGINGPFSDNSENIALIPETNLPITINNVNNGVVGGSGNIANCTPPNGSLAFSQFFVDNIGSNTEPVYNGLTRVIVAEAVVQACEVYTIKLAVGDAFDGILDSGVFLEARSFGNNNFDLTLTNLALDGTLAEGCDTAFLNFEIASASDVDRVLGLEVFGTATPGVDYTQLPDSILIPAGDTVVVFPIAAFEDGIVEGDEEIQIIFDRNICITDTLKIRIIDNILVPPLLPDSVEVCSGDTLNLDATLPVVPPEPPRFESDGTITFGLEPAEYSSFIDVQGVLPVNLDAGVIKSVCIDSLTHQWISDLDIFLIGPNEQILELTTDNGADGGNGFGEDAYINTCFTATAVDPIAGPTGQAPASFVPFTGEWMPEGPFSSIYDGNFQTNGQWELRIFDDELIGVGTLWNWSICIESFYDIEYQWSDPTQMSCDTCPITDVYVEGPTTYYVTATDSYGCRIVDSVEAVPDPGLGVPEANCGFVTDSSIQFSWNPVVDAFGYEVRLEGREFIDVGTDLSYTFTGLLPSTAYTITVRADFDPCIGSSQEITCVTGPCLSPLLNAQATDLDCFGDIDGTITTTSTTGGRAPYSYSLNNIPMLGGDTIGLASGNYQLIVMDTVGCADTVDLVVDEPEAISLMVEQLTFISCNGANDATLVSTANGGEAPYVYSWNNVIGTDTLSGQAAGDYELVIEDANGCTSTTNITVSEPTLLSGNVSGITPQNCTGPPDGSITIDATGGTPPYNYEWSEEEIGNTPTATGLQAGAYSVTVTDAAGCSFDLAETVDLETSLVAQGVETDLSCNEDNSGTITASVNSGQPPFQFDWSGPGNPSGGATINGLQAGDYQLVITDDRGCTDSLEFSLSEPEPLVGDAEVSPVDCSSDVSGGIDWSGFGGVQPYTYAWSNGATSQDLFGVPSGDYELVVTDANGCTIEQTYFIDFFPSAVLETIIDSVSCFGGSDGGVFGQLANATPPYDLYWVRQGTNDSIAGLNLTEASAGTYQLVGTDALGCEINTNVTIPQPSELILQAVKSDIRCFGEDNGLIELNATGGNPVYQYRLDNGAYQTNGVFIGLEPGRHAAFVRDDNGCVTELPAIEIIEPDPLEVELGDDLVIVWGDSIQLIPDIQGGSGVIVSYQWVAFDSTILDCFDCAVVYAKPEEQTTIRLRVTDDFGCAQEDFLTIFINKDFPVEVPTGFTPNGDGANDRLIVHGVPGTEVLSFQVFNRWGGLVYDAENFPVNDARFGWNGEFQDEPASGTFIWQVIARLPDGTEKNYHGQSTLIR